MTQEADRDERIERLRVAASQDAAVDPQPSVPTVGTAKGDEEAESQSASQASADPAVFEGAIVSGPHPLRFPFRIGEVRFDTVSLCEPSFEDIEDVRAGRISEFELHARMAGVDVSVLRSLKWSDSEMVTLMARRIAPELRRR